MSLETCKGFIFDPQAGHVLKTDNRRFAWWGGEYRDESVSTAAVGTKTRTFYKSVHAW